MLKAGENKKYQGQSSNRPWYEYRLLSEMLSRLFGAQPKSIGEKRIGWAIAGQGGLDGNLVTAARPGVGQFTHKRLVAKEDIRHPLPLGARQPGSHPGVGLRQLIRNDEYQNALNSGFLIKLPAHPNASKINDHAYMSPTFQRTLCFRLPDPRFYLYHGCSRNTSQREEKDCRVKSDSHQCP